MAKKNTLKEAPYRKRWRYDEDDTRVDLGWELAEYATTYGNHNPIEWRPNEPFHATLHLLYFERGRSAARFIWEDEETGTLYPMFMSGMLDVAQNTLLNHGRVLEEQWIVVKRGSNYGIERYSG